MMGSLILTAPDKTKIQVHDSFSSPELRRRLEDYFRRDGENVCLSKHPACLDALAKGLRHQPFLLEATCGDQVQGFLPLAYMRSLLFGRYLVGLPYLNYGGVAADDAEVARSLVDEAGRLADRLNVRYLELRHEQPITHPMLSQTRCDKVHMQLELPSNADALWNEISGKVRNQLRKAQKQPFTVHWGNEELLTDFYAVFSRNMRDLGTPVFSKGLFRSFCRAFPDRVEYCVIRNGREPIAGAMLMHGWGITEVPSASSLRQYNSSCANMLLYWHLLQRSLERGQTIFDFGRSSEDSNTYRFKKQWGAKPLPAHWQYYVRNGSIDSARRDNPRYERFIRLWQRLPVRVTRWIGPAIVRGIP